jgi:hypothetical protein
MDNVHFRFIRLRLTFYPQALAKSYLVLFTQVLENDEPEVKEIALQVRRCG